MTPTTATFAIKLASAGLVAFGLLNLAALVSPVSAFMDLFIDLAFWPVDGGQIMSGDAGRLWIGISGGLLAGLGVCIWQIAARIMPDDFGGGRAIILPAFLTWFVIDGLGSALAGAPFNAAVNLIFLAIFIAPLQLAKPAGNA